MKKIRIIAEIGCNHNGDYSLAKEMVKSAKEAGVDGVKFQIFDSRELISKIAPKAEYQIISTGNEETQLEMTQKLEIGVDNYVKLKEYAESLGLEVFATPFDLKSIDFLSSIGQTTWKIPSGEITNLPYLRKISQLPDDIEIILSTGMASISEIKKCIEILDSKEAKKIIILHCNTEYPTQDEDVNISALVELKREFPNRHIGFSDHSIGIVAPIMSVVYGVELIEKHFTLDRNMNGPDHKASIEPDDLKLLVNSVRRAEVMYGCEAKIVTNSEYKNKIIARKSIIANKQIKKGDVFSECNLTCKRPGNGISPLEWDRILGMESERDFDNDELITDTRFEIQK